MAGAAPSSNGMIAGINMTPLVDIMLVLLIIFLVTAKITTTPPSAIPMTLPKSSTGQGIVMVFAVSLGKDGETVVNDQRLSSDEAIKPIAAAELAKHSDLRAVIQADGKVMHERVIHVLDLLSQAGVSQIAFAVTPTGPSTTP